MESREPIDLRSDTFTVPNAAMRRAMADAEVGDDVWGEDPTVARLEERTAEILGKEAGLYVVSGTMGNLIAVAAQTRPGDEVIADSESHIAIYEVAGAAVVSGVQLRLLESFEGCPAPDAVIAAIRSEDIHVPISRLLCLENTHNRRGGAAVAIDRIGAAADTARSNGLRVHCDGARLMNAAVALQPTDPLRAAAELVHSCDTVSICLSKGLGAPVGSVLCGDADVIAAARRWRKRLGGGMRQAGIIAAAGIWALEQNVSRIAHDHARASRLAEALRDVAELVLPAVATNIVLVRVVPDAGEVAARCAAEGVKVTVMGPRMIRCMTYLGVEDADIARAIDVLRTVLGSTEPRTATLAS